LNQSSQHYNLSRLAALAQDSQEFGRPQGVPRYIWLPLLQRLVTEVDAEQRSKVAKRLGEAAKRRVPGGFPRGSHEVEAIWGEAVAQQQAS